MVPFGLALLGDQQRGGLRQVPVEQLVELVAGIHPDHGGRNEPDEAHQPQHTGQQPGLERTKTCQAGFLEVLSAIV